MAQERLGQAMQQKNWRLGSLAILVALTACSGGSEVVEATGSTGTCATVGVQFSGEPLPGTNLPGRVVEAAVECPDSEMSDPRLSGAVRSEFRCEYSDEDGVILADCQSDTVVTNDRGTWREDDGTFTITGTDVGVQGTVIQEGRRVGTGEYEGLQFTYRMEGVEHTYPWSISGTIEPTK